MASDGSMAWPIFGKVIIALAVVVFARIALPVVAAGKWRRDSIFFEVNDRDSGRSKSRDPVKFLSAESSSTSWPSSGINYEVFLNFRGTDTRTGFTDLLHKRLENDRIMVFKDDKNLRAGEEIDQGLKDAIKRSRISIAIFSKDYASSKSCLMELVQMWECRESNKQIIIPVFYDVCPKDVKHQTGDFATSFEKHEKDGEVDANTIKRWKEVLQLVGGLKGYHWENVNGGHVSDLLERVHTCVLEVLKKRARPVTDKLVGIDLHVQEMMRNLGVVYSEDGQAIEVCGGNVPVIAICGMRGVGKTTLAKVVFNEIYEFFDGCSFLEDINSKEVKVSQELLISDLQKEKCASLRSSDDGIKIIGNRFSNMKVLIVLDDVREVEQIEKLVGKLTWFGSGSRIIVTTDRMNVFTGFEDKAAVKEHKLEPMRDDHALQLFCKHAFQGDDALRDVSECDSLSIDIVGALGGHPLAIVLWAGYLRHNRKEIDIWRETLEIVKKNRGDRVEKKVNDAFMASYNSLDHCTKQIFLDVACFSIGTDQTIARYMWSDCDYYPASGIKRLCEMFLLEIGENNELRMHDLLRNFGRELVESEGLHERSRFWNYRDMLSFLRDGKGTENVQCIGLKVEEGCTVSCEELYKMSNLRYLGLDRANIQGLDRANIQGTTNLLPNLRWLEWKACRLISELDNMHLKKLVSLNLSGSPVTGDSQVWRQIMEKMKMLKVLNLQGCSLPPLNFPAPINLEILILEDCTLLSEIGPFISKLKNLSSLNLRKCSLVKQLPQELGRMESLRELLIDGTGIHRIHFQDGSLENLEILSACDCKELKDISTIGRIRKLKSLALDGANIDWDPEIFEFPQELRRLSLRNCWIFNELPPSIGKLVLLEVMDLSYTGITKMPPSVKHLRNLKTLKMERTHLRKFPEDIVKLENLEELDFSGCRSMEGHVSCDISGLSSLKILRLSSTDVAGLPQSIYRLSRLQTLDILNCNQLQALPRLPYSLQSLRWGSKDMTVPDLSYLTTLRTLCLKVVQQPKAGLLNPNNPNIGWITGLPNLETLELSLPNVTNLPGHFSALTKLRELCLSYMKELELTQLPSSSSLRTLRLKHCTIPEPKFSSLKHLSELELDNCNIAKIDGLADLQLLELLKIFHCSSLTNLNGLEKIRRLRKVQVDSSPLVVLPELLERVEVDR